eukprot:6013338-Pyramimonas_sp.AAC.1
MVDKNLETGLLSRCSCRARRTEITQYSRVSSHGRPAPFDSCVCARAALRLGPWTSRVKISDTM